jgi:hypothetical protein
MICLRHQTLITRSLQSLLPVLPPFLREPSPLLALHRLPLFSDLALELLAFAGELP